MFQYSIALTSMLNPPFVLNHRCRSCCSSYLRMPQRGIPQCQRQSRPGPCWRPWLRMMPKIAKAQEVMEENGRDWKRMEENGREKDVEIRRCVLAFSSGSGLEEIGLCTDGTAKLRKPQKIQKILEGFARG